MTHRFNFKSIDTVHRSLVHKWLTEPHAAEWFYGEGLQNTFNGIDKSLKGSLKAHYWLAYDKKHLFSFFITSHVEKTHDEWTK